MVEVVNRGNGAQELVRTQEDDQSSFSFVDIIERVDKLPLDFGVIPDFQQNVFYLTTHEGAKVGFVCRFVLDEMLQYAAEEVKSAFTVDESTSEIRFTSDDFETRNSQIAAIANILREKSDIEDLKGWRDERYAVWSPSHEPYVLVERSMAGPLGIITYGVHINGYFFDDSTKEIRFWIPRRSATKPTWPYILDNMVAGGIGYPCGIYETVLKESMEEANLEKEVIEKGISSGGVVSYLFYQGNPANDHFNNQKSYIVGEVEHVYDMKLDHTVIPKPNDGEVDSFNVMSLPEVMEALQNGEFKPNCALVMIDFLVRHGYITTNNEPRYLELSNKMHRTLPFPTRD